MDDKAVSVGAWFKRGWAEFRAQPRPLLLSGLVYAVCFTVLGRIASASLAFDIAARAVSVILLVGLVDLCLVVVRGNAAEPSALFGGFYRIGHIIVAAGLHLLILCSAPLVGLAPRMLLPNNPMPALTLLMVVMIAPSIIWALKYSMWPFLMVDRGLSGIASLSASGKLTQGHKGKLFIAFAVGILAANVLSIPAAVAGGPTSYYALAIAARAFATPLLCLSLAAAYDSLSELKAKLPDLPPLKD